jgi:hypothetical protein
VVGAISFTPGQQAITSVLPSSAITRYGAAVHTLPLSTSRRTTVDPLGKAVTAFAATF